MMKIIQQLIGFVMMISIGKMLLFPSHTPSEAERMELFPIKLNHTEYLEVQKLRTDEERRDATRRIWRMYDKQRTLEAKKKAQKFNKRVGKYFKEKSNGTFTPGEMMWNMREDFFLFTEKQGGVWNKTGEIIKKKC